MSQLQLTKSEPKLVQAEKEYLLDSNWKGLGIAASGTVISRNLCHQDFLCLSVLFLSMLASLSGRQKPPSVPGFPATLFTANWKKVCLCRWLPAKDLKLIWTRLGHIPLPEPVIVVREKGTLTSLEPRRRTVSQRGIGVLLPKWRKGYGQNAQRSLPVVVE